MNDPIRPEDKAPRRPMSPREAVDRWGADPARWPDAALAHAARLAMLSDRSFRAYCDDADSMDLCLKAAAEALDARLARVALDRIAAGVRAGIAPPPAPRWYRRIAAMAAAVIVAGVLGGASSLFFNLPGDQQSYSVVQLDPLIFGPSSEQDF